MKDKSEDLKSRIDNGRKQIQKAGSYRDFYAFIKRQKGNYSGLSSPNISNLKKDIDEETNSDVLEEYSFRVETFEEAVDKYLKSKVSNAVRFHNTRWYAYFFYNFAEDQARLGRAVLSIDGDGHVKLENVKDNVSTNYEGTFELVGDYVAFYDLEGNREGAKIHIKILTGEKPREISIGTYTSFERQQVTSGAIVFEHKTDEREILTPGAFTYSKDPEFKNIPEEIRKFLSLKSLNHIKVPQNIYSYIGLQEFNVNYPRRRNKRKLFFDVDEPILFLSSPSYSLQPEKHEQKSAVLNDIISKLRKNLGRDNIPIQIHYPGSYDVNRGRRRLNSAKKAILDNFEMLKRTKFFVLIYDSNAVSTSLIELGWALAHCPVVLIFYNEVEGFPEVITTISNSRRYSLLDTKRIRSMEEDKDFITAQIEFEVRDHLNVEFGEEE